MKKGDPIFFITHLLTEAVGSLFTNREWSEFQWTLIRINTALGDLRKGSDPGSFNRLLSGILDQSLVVFKTPAKAKFDNIVDQLLDPKADYKEILKELLAATLRWISDDPEVEIWAKAFRSRLGEGVSESYARRRALKVRAQWVLEFYKGVYQRISRIPRPGRGKESSGKALPILSSRILRALLEITSHQDSVLRKWVNMVPAEERRDLLMGISELLSNHLIKSGASDPDQLVDELEKSLLLFLDTIRPRLNTELTPRERSKLLAELSFIIEKEHQKSLSFKESVEEILWNSLWSPLRIRRIGSVESPEGKIPLFWDYYAGEYLVARPLEDKSPLTYYDPKEIKTLERFKTLHHLGERYPISQLGLVIPPDGGYQSGKLAGR